MLIDFRCKTCSTKEEHWVSSDTTTVRCKCGGEATRVISGGNFNLDPISGHFPGATLKWAKHHEKMAKQSSD